MTDLQSLFGIAPAKMELPPCPEVALTLALTFQRLGGGFSIDSTGRRGVFSPCCALGDDLPQPLPDAIPSDCFQSEDEWQGALKLVRALLGRLHPSDRDYVFDMFAIEAMDPRNIAPSIEGPTRSVQQ
jgi:hypothetical protein